MIVEVVHYRWSPNDSLTLKHYQIKFFFLLIKDVFTWSEQVDSDKLYQTFVPVILDKSATNNTLYIWFLLIWMHIEKFGLGLRSNCLHWYLTGFLLLCKWNYKFYVINQEKARQNKKKQLSDLRPQLMRSLNTKFGDVHIYVCNWVSNNTVLWIFQPILDQW